MAKIVDITEKLDFDSNPIIKIKDTEVEVNADAETVLRIMGVLGGDVTPKAVVEMYELIFGEEERKAIAGFKLQYKDFEKLVMEAVNLIIGNSEKEGE